MTPLEEFINDRSKGKPKVVKDRITVYCIQTNHPKLYGRCFIAYCSHTSDASETGVGTLMNIGLSAFKSKVMQLANSSYPLKKIHNRNYRELISIVREYEINMDLTYINPKLKIETSRSQGELDKAVKALTELHSKMYVNQKILNNPQRLRHCS